MRLGGPVHEEHVDPESWVSAVKRQGYSAAYCPVGDDADDATVRAYADAAAAAGVIIAEVGAWSNPVSPDEKTCREAMELCIRRLALAERIGANCCVNIAGSRGEQWDGPHPDNLTPAGLERIVESVRRIIDAVEPRRTFYTLETMPWMYPDSADSYLELIRAIDRKPFAVHFDPVNLVCSPQRFHGNGRLVRDFVARLGERIKSVHLKDIALSGKLTVHLDEVRPGLGGMDYPLLLRELDRLDADLPVMLEHLPKPEDYAQAAEFVRSAAAGAGVQLK